MNQSESIMRSLRTERAGKACEEATFGFAFVCDWHEIFKISLVTRRWKFLHRVIINIPVYHKKGNVAQCKKTVEVFLFL